MKGKKTFILGLIGLFIISSLSISIAENINENENISYFRVENNNGRWYFIDPYGEPFFSTGICGVSSNYNYAPDLGYSPYYKNIIELYGSEEVWANVTKQRMDEWCFNTVGYGDKYIIDTGHYYTKGLGMAGANWQTGEIPDYFSNEWIQRVEKIGKNVVSNLSDDHNLIGYFLDNELHWGTDWRSLLDLFDTYLQLSANSAGKIALVDFLRQKYNDNITQFNKNWRTNLDNFDQILYVNILGKWPYTVIARNDHNDFNYFVADQYFKTCYYTIKKYDPNHLILGARFQSFLTPIEVVRASSKYIDVISVNHYVTRPLVLPLALFMQDIFGFTRSIDSLDEFYKISQKPILISEFYFRAVDSGLPNTKPSRLIMPVVKNQRQRAIFAEVYTRLFINKPYSIGYHWFAYSDQPSQGRFDGENSNIGLVNINDEPYELLITRMKIVNTLAHNSVKN